MALEGNLQDLSLPNICQIICLERRRVNLALRRGQERASIMFDGGEITHAAVGKLEGEEAVYHLLTWTDGSFRTTTDAPARRTIAMRWDQILMEGMKRLDELERDRAAAAPAKSVARELTAAEIEHDAALENEIILLMSRLDVLRARLDERGTRKRPAQALQILTGIANHTIELAEALRADERAGLSLAAVVNRATATYTSAQGLEIGRDRVAAEEVVALYANASNPPRREQVFRDLSQSLISITDEYFAGLTACFRSPAATDELREATGCFLHDLTNAVGSVRA